MVLKTQIDVNSFFERKVLPEVNGNSYWENKINSIIDGVSNNSIHLAICVEPYLQYMIDGKKTVESRFSINRIAPYGHVNKGDVILLKKSCGPIYALCQVSDVWYYRLDPSTWFEIKDTFSEMLCAQDPNFWKTRERATFASLMRISNIIKINPLQVKKKDRRGWVVLKAAIQNGLF